MQALPIHFENQDDHPAQRALLGLSVITIGGLALADRLHWIEQPLLHTFWPVALVLVGLARLVWPSHKNSAVFGAGLMLVGALMTANNLGLTTVPLRDAWPVFVILAGVGLMQRAKLPRVPATSIAGDRIHLDATFSNLHQRSESPHFQGGRVELNFSNVELDLSQTTMAGAEAVLQVEARGSSLEVRVPHGWQVVVDMTATGGAITNRTVSVPQPTRRLVLRGSLRVGGIQITH